MSLLEARRTPVPEPTAVGSPETTLTAELRLPANAGVSANLGENADLTIVETGDGDPLGHVAGPGRIELDLCGAAGRLVRFEWSGGIEDLTLESSWRPTNVVLIVCDTLRADILEQTSTPGLDALARESVRFSNSFSHAPMTLPSHTALFSSRYPHTTGVVNNGQRVPRSLPLLAEWLSEYGYETHAVTSLGTLWLGKPGLSLDRGFETFEHARLDYAAGEETAPLLDEVVGRLPLERPFFLFAHFADPHEPYRDTEEHEDYATLSLDDRVLERFNAKDAPHLDHHIELGAGRHTILLESDSDAIRVRSLHAWSAGPWQKPRALQFITGELRRPTQRLTAEFELPTEASIDLEAWVGDAAMSPYEIPRRYKGEVTRADKAIGTLIDSLKSRGLWDRSLVIFSSDHGESIGDHMRVGHVETLYDALLHVPLMIKLPSGEEWAEYDARLRARRDLLVRHIDLTPTLLELLGLPALPGQMGSSILADTPRLLLSETHKPEARRNLYSCRDTTYKLIFEPETDTFTMFHVATDPGETVDVFEAEGGERLDWQDLLRRTARAFEGGGSSGPDEEERSRLEAMGYF